MKKTKTGKTKMIVFFALANHMHNSILSCSQNSKTDKAGSYFQPLILSRMEVLFPDDPSYRSVGGLVGRLLRQSVIIFIRQFVTLLKIEKNSLAPCLRILVNSTQSNIPFQQKNKWIDIKIQVIGIYIKTLEIDKQIEIFIKD